MPRDSIGRRVARAAATGGSKSYKSRTPWGWYASLMIVCVLGIGLIAVSRHDRLNRLHTSATTTTSTTTPAQAPPTVSNHWQSALSVDICGTVRNLPTSASQASGLATPGNGVVNIAPALAGKNAAQYEGANANLGRFLSSESVNLQDTSLTLPSSLGKLAGTYKNGHKCGSKPGEVQLAIWKTPTTSTPVPVTKSLQQTTFANGEMFMVAFVPTGTKIPSPPAKSLVNQFLAVNPNGTVPTTTSTTSPSVSSTTTTTAASGTTTTTSSAPGSTSTTTAG